MTSSIHQTHYDVVIVGAGVSGLTAAFEIFKQDPSLKVKILEANPKRVGGRNYVDDEGTDLGSGYIGPTQDRVSHLIDELGLQLYKVYTKGKTVQVLEGRKPTPFEGIIPPISTLGLLDVNNAMVQLDKIAESVNLESPHLTPNAEELDSITIAEMMRNHCATQDAANLMRTAVRAVCCCEPEEISVLGFSWYVKSSGNIKRVVETENGAQDSKVKGGTGQISLELAKRLPKDWIQLNSPVREIVSTTSQSDPQVVTLQVSVNNELTLFRAKYVILAIPPAQQARIEFTPSLHSNHRQALQHYPMGHIIKTFTFYEKPFWREKGFNGAIVSDNAVTLVTLDDSGADAAGIKPCIMGFVLSKDASKWGAADKTPEDRRDALAKHYAFAFGTDEALKPIAYKEHNWASETWVGGCYVNVPTPATLTKFPGQINYKETFRLSTAPRVFLAGTERAADFIGYLEGAVESGQRSARNVLVELGKLDRAKNFNVVMKPEKPSKQNPYVPMELSWAEKHIVPSVQQVKFAFVFGLCAAVGGYFFSNYKHIIQSVLS
jgi:monoamine oxidase